MTDIKQLLKHSEFQAIRNANAPALANPFATMADLTGGGGILPANQWYVLQQNFDKGVVPPGWTQATSGVPATVSYTQPYETGAIGQVQMNMPGPAAGFASLTYASGYNYLLDFSDCDYTKWNSLIRRDPAHVGVSLVGLANNGGSAVPSAFGNVIALVHDPNNMTTVNGGLTGNWFVWIKDASGQTLYNTGIAPTNIWQFVEFEYNYEGVPYVEVKINGVVVATVPNTDPNLFVSQAPAANAGLKPVLYCGKTAAATGGNQLRVDQFNLYRKWI